MMVSFTSIKREKVYKVIVEKIKKSIINGKLKPGDKLPSERELETQLEVSRTSIREAFRTLELMGMIEIKPGKGSYVKNIDREDFLEYLNISLNSTKKPIAEFFETRIAIESRAAELIIENNSGIEELDKILKKQEENINNSESIIEIGISFHNELIKKAENSVLYRVWFLLSGIFKESLQETGEKVEKYPKIDLKEHRKIYEAIKKGDKKEARKAIEEHLKKLESVVE